jgi:hypothetical protein
MKGILIATALSILFATSIFIVFRFWLPKRRAAFILKFYFASLPILVVFLVLTPADCWFLPEWLTEGNILLDWIFAFFVYSSSVFGGWMQLYNLADRGLSLRILIDGLESPNRRIDAEFVENFYGAGKGIQWMYAKRLADIERLDLVVRNGRDFVLSPKGAKNACLIGKLRFFYSLPLTRELE